MKPWHVLFGLLIFLGFYLYWPRADDAELRAVEQERQRLGRILETWKARSDSVAELNAVLAARNDSLRSVASAQLRAARQQERRADVQLRQAGATVNATLDSLVRAVPEPVVPLVDELRLQIQDERTAARSVAGALRAQITHQATLVATLASDTLRLRARVDVLDSLAGAQAQALEAANNLAGLQARRRSRADLKGRASILLGCATAALAAQSKAAGGACLLAGLALAR